MREGERCPCGEETESWGVQKGGARGGGGLRSTPSPSFSPTSRIIRNRKHDRYARVFCGKQYETAVFLACCSRKVQDEDREEYRKGRLCGDCAARSSFPGMMTRSKIPSFQLAPPQPQALTAFSIFLSSQDVENTRPMPKINKSCKVTAPRPAPYTDAHVLMPNLLAAVIPGLAPAAPALPAPVPTATPQPLLHNLDLPPGFHKAAEGCVEYIAQLLCGGEVRGACLVCVPCSLSVFFCHACARAVRVCELRVWYVCVCVWVGWNWWVCWGVWVCGCMSPLRTWVEVAKIIICPSTCLVATHTHVFKSDRIHSRTNLQCAHASGWICY